MTSIEWLEEKLAISFGNELTPLRGFFVQAKEMHKQEIVNTYIIADSESTIEESEYNAIKYYERTFKKDCL